MPRSALLGAVLVSAVAHAADGFAPSARLTLGAGVDTNARRTLGESHSAAVGSGLISLEGKYLAEKWLIFGSYDGGARYFVRVPSENVLVQAGYLEASHAVGRFLGVGVWGRAKDRTAMERAYTDLAAAAFVEYVPDARLDIRLRAGGHRFLYHPNFPYSFAASEVGAYARYRFTRQHSLFAAGEHGSRRYNADSRPAPLAPASGRRRKDLVVGASLGYQHRGKVSFSAAYGYDEQSSSSFGESLQRHRLTATLGLRLPLELFLVSQATLQLSRYPDGIFLSPEIILEDDERHNAFVLRLSRPVHDALDVELRYALYRNELPSSGLYLRQTLFLGTSFRL